MRSRYWIVAFALLTCAVSSAWAQKLAPDKIHLEYRQLVDSLSVTVIPAVQSEPAHIRVLFGNAPEREYFAHETAQLLIYPMGPYRDLFKHPELREFNRQIRQLDSLCRLPLKQITGPIPILPAVEAEQNFALHVQKLSFFGGTGLRFVTMFTQDAAPITNERIFYTFQGLTADQRTYVAMYYPLHCDVLPDSDAQILTELLAVLNDPQQYAAYQGKTLTTLQNYPENQFTPRLSALDSVISTLSFAP